MARTYKDMVEWRRRTSSVGTWSGWTEVSTNGDATSPLTFATPLATGYEYEIRVTRSKPGSVTKISDGDTNGQPNYLAVGTVTLAAGASMTMPGTYSVPNLGSSVTVTRTKGGSPSLVIDLGGANWTYVAVEYNDGADRYKAVFNSGKGPTVSIGGNTFSEDSNVIVESGRNTNIINVKLASSQAFILYVDYNGKSSGSISVTAL